MFIKATFRGDPMWLNVATMVAISPYTNPHQPGSPNFENYRTFNAIVSYGDEREIYVDQTVEQILAMADPCNQGPFTMETKDVIAGIRKNFQAYMAVKTGWGRNEVLKAFDDSTPEFLK